MKLEVLDDIFKFLFTFVKVISKLKDFMVTESGNKDSIAKIAFYKAKIKSKTNILLPSIP